MTPRKAAIASPAARAGETATAGLESAALQRQWRELNERYFAGLLPPVPIVWSRRLTSSVGLFVSRHGPRSRNHREIRLSWPLLERLTTWTPYAEQELRNTLAHEMIHQWQFDVLTRRPDHGPDFLRKMTEMNRDGGLAVTIYHSLQKEVLALARFAWRCRVCGRVYRRQRRTIEPRRHQCGSCRGALQELKLVAHNSTVLRRHPSQRPFKTPASPSVEHPAQLSFLF